MSGYAKPEQKTAGIHQRQWARVFIIAEKKDPSKRIVYVNMDTWVTSQAVKMTVVDRLKNSKYRYDNVFISSTHSHSTSGGYDWYFLYNFATMGFNKQNFNAVVNGVINAIMKAESNLSDGGRILINSGQLLNTHKK
jgi:neutral ceramidase